MDAGSRVPFWLLVTCTSLSCSMWDDAKAECRRMCSRHILKHWLHRQSPGNSGLLCSGKINSCLEQHRWRCLRRARTPSKPVLMALGCSGNGKWLMFGQLCFQRLFWVEGFFPYGKCNKQKYCLKVLLNICFLFYLLIFCLSFSLLP